MAILQIIYLVINIFGFGIGLYAFCGSDDLPAISTLFSFISKRLGNAAVVLFGILFIFLFLPAITAMSALIMFTMLLGNYTH